MRNLKNIESFITEKRVTVKRRYTEKHPAKNVSTAARVRSAILDAVADGHLTEDEVNNILSEIKAHKRWLKRNVGLFNISEDETGIKRYSLSPYGHRVRTATAPLNEALKVPHKEQGKKKVNMFVGRFQPFTLGHVKVFEKMYKENGKPVVVFLVRGKNNDSEKRPFDEEIQQAMFAKMAKQYPFLETAIVVPNGSIDTMFAAARPAYEPVMWGYGTDRKKSYGAMIDKQSYRDQLGVDPDFKGYEIFRTDDNISASKVRNALKIDDEKTFKKMTPKSIHSFYKPLQNILEPIKENNNMKNLKSLTDFSVNESLNEGKKAKAKNPNKVNTIDIDLSGDDSDIMDAIKSFNLKVKSNGANKGTGYDMTGKNKDILDYLQSDYYALDARDIEEMFPELLEGEVNEEYIESMDSIEIANALGKIKTLWDTWKGGPMTEPSDIKPAQRELKGWMDRWFKQNIK
jgi:cytidyltransferase-like protein